MTGFWTRRAATAGLGLAATLLLAVAGCGGGEEKIGDAVVTTEPGTSDTGTSAPAAGSNAAAPATDRGSEGGAAAPTTPAGNEGAAVKAEGFGTLKGQVVFDGNPPDPGPLVPQGKAEKDPEVCASQNAIPNQRFVVDPQSKGVKFALVYIPRPTAVSPEAESEAKSKEYVFDQSNCTFEPHVLGMAKGGKLLIKSSDPVGHNVNSKVENYSSLNSAVPPGSSLPVTDLKFNTGRPGEVVCDIHPWMKAWWMVLNNPYIAVTDEQGNFEIKNVPAGTQKVVVWQEAVHPKFVTAPSGEPVTIAKDGETTHTFHIKADQVK